MNDYYYYILLYKIIITLICFISSNNIVVFSSWMESTIAIEILSILINICRGPSSKRIYSNLSSVLKIFSINLSCWVVLLLMLALMLYFHQILDLYLNLWLFLRKLIIWLFLSSLLNLIFYSWRFIFFVYLIFLPMTKVQASDP